MEPETNSNTDLVLAMKRGDMETVKRLISNPDTTPMSINEAFVLAATLGQYRVFLMLLDDQRITQESKNEALVQAALNGRAKLVRQLYNDPAVNGSGIGKAVGEIEKIDTEAREEGVTTTMESYRMVLNILGGVETMQQFPVETWKKIMAYTDDKGKVVLSTQHSTFRDLFDEFEEPGEDSFFKAVNAGKLVAVQHLLSVEKFKIDPAEKDNRALFAAASGGHVEIVNLLLQYPKVTRMDDLEAALILAASNGHVQVVDVFIGRPEIYLGDFEVLNRVLKAAVFPGHLNVVERLFQEEFVEETTIVDMRNEVYFDAIQFGHRNIVAFVLGVEEKSPSTGKGIYTRDMTSAEGGLDHQTGFFQAVRMGKVDIVTDLLKHPKIDPAEDSGPPFYRVQYAITLARIEHHAKTLEVLLADPRIHVTDLESSHWYADHIIPEDNEIVKVLLDSPHVRASASDFRKAVEISNGEIIRFDEIILSKIEPWKVEPSDLTLDFIRRVDYSILIDFLERANFDLTRHGHGLLDSSIRRQTSGVTEYLLAKGATFDNDGSLGINIIVSLRDDPEKTEKFLNDPRFDGSVQGSGLIETMAKLGYLKTVGLLLKDPRVDPTANKNKALKLAVEHEHASVVTLLLADERITPAPKILSNAIGADLSDDVIVALLESEKIDPSWNNNEALMAAAREKRGSVAGMILNDDRVDPSLGNNSAAREAMRFVASEVFEFILASPRFRLDKQFVIDAIVAHSIFLPSILGHPQTIPFLKDAFETALNNRFLLAIPVFLQQPALVLSNEEIDYYESIAPDDKNITDLFDYYRRTHSLV